MRGRKRLLVPLPASAGLADGAGEEAGEQREAEEDEHRLGDGPDRDVEVGGVEAEPVGKHRQVEPAEHGVHDDLEERVDGDEDGRQFPAAAGQVVPDEDHGDAAGQPDDDQAGAQLGQVGQEHPGEGEHQQRPDQPVQHQRQGEGATVGQLVAEMAVADLGQDGVHHRQQPDGDGQRDGVDLDALEAVVEVGDQAAEQQPAGHGQTDPDRQEPVEGGQLLGDRAEIGAGIGGGQRPAPLGSVRPVSGRRARPRSWRRRRRARSPLGCSRRRSRLHPRSRW